MCGPESSPHRLFDAVASNCTPCGTALASSWDTDLLEEVGHQLGTDAIAKKVHVLLGPTINLARSPLGGRNFESMGEDPLLAGVLAGHFIKGVQSKGVAATLKHFVGNEQEYQRESSDSVIPMRALREIYLEAFRIAISVCEPKCFMTGYNKVNGVSCSENGFLINDVLRGEWGFDGLVMSDWTGVYSCAESIRAGLDLEMPGPPLFRGKQLVKQVDAGKIHEFELDDSLRRYLELCNYLISEGREFGGDEEMVDDAESRALLRKAAAETTVLLRNEGHLLPISANKGIKRIAVIGSSARLCLSTGGGSASLTSIFTVSPLEGIRAAAKEAGIQVDYHVGLADFLYIPLATPFCSHPTRGKEAGRYIGQVELWKECPTSLEEWKSAGAAKPTDEASWSNATDDTQVIMLIGPPPEINESEPFVRIRYTFTPDFTGDWLFSLTSSTTCNLYLDGRLVVDNGDTSWKAGEIWSNHGSEERTAVIKDMQCDREYAVEIRGWYTPDPRGVPFKNAGGYRFGAFPAFVRETALEEAAKLAKEADLAIVLTGLNDDFEGEGADRETLDLPPAANQMITSVLAAQPNTIIVNQSGSPVAMPWAERAPAILQAWYGGSNLGNGIADVLFGKVNPSAKLPMSFINKLEDLPSGLGFGKTGDHDRQSYYHEGIFVGYRHLDRHSIAPTFPFGHGLSYTTFSYASLSVSPISIEGEYTVTCVIENTGPVAGKEIIQLYIEDVESSLSRPKRELKGFKKIYLEPGEKKTVTFEMTRDSLRYWHNTRDRWVAEKGVFKVWVGASSRDLRLEGEVELREDLWWR